jgi:UDPglucose 6-dehydrogenase
MSVIADNCPNIEVTVVDKDDKKIAAWNDKNLNNLPIFEPGLKEVVSRNRNKNLFFSTDIKNSIKNADMVFISVNTPTKNKGFGAGYASDLKWVESCARQVSKYSRGHTIIVEKSTVPVKTAELIEEILVSNKKVKNISKKTFSVLSSPEFLAEGTAIKDLENPDRVLIGGSDKFAINQLRDIYLRWIPEEKILLTNIWSSELSKLIANAFLAQRVSSINSISALCESTGADIKEVVKAIGSDKRIGNKFLSPGPGFGGSCFKKDILNLVYLCRFYKLDTIAEYWEQVMLINNWQKQRISALVVEKLYGTVSNKKILMLGFSFKSNTNDTRESPAIAIAKDLIDNGAELLVNDPKVTKNQIEKEIGIKELDIEEISYGKWEFVTDIYDASNGADAVILITDWDNYKNLNWEKISSLLRKPSWIFDTRGIISDDLLLKINSNFWQVGYPMTNS